MQGIGNQSNAKYEFKDNDCTSHQEAEIQAKEMVTIDIKLKLVHVENLQHRRSNKDKPKQDFNGKQYGFLESQ